MQFLNVSIVGFAIIDELNETPLLAPNVTNPIGDFV